MNRPIKMRQEPTSLPPINFGDFGRKNKEGKNQQEYMQNLHGK